MPKADKSADRFVMEVNGEPFSMPKYGSTPLSNKIQNKFQKKNINNSKTTFANHFLF